MIARMTIILAALALFGAGFIPPAAAVDLDKRVSFDIPAQKLSSALIEFSQQAQIQVVTGDDVSNLTTRGLKGSHTIRAALQQLLADTGLKPETVTEKSVVLKRETPSTSSSSPADQMRVAENTTLAKSSGAGSADKDGADDEKNQVTVEDTRIRAFTDRNADLPRTADDPQPYYIFDSKTIEQSAAVNLEEFLRQRLPMNAVGRTPSQMDAIDLPSNVAMVDLRGLGSDRTLVLINGRRWAGVNPYQYHSQMHQPDINGIALSAIDRIEVLPTSASGIYGAGAMGGVVNIILKQDYKGGEARLNYENAADADAPIRTANFTYGHSLERGKTNIMLTAQFADGEPLRLKHRRKLFERGLNTVLNNAPDRIHSLLFPFMGATPNILGIDASFNATDLVLKNGVALNSPMTHLPPGVAPNTPVEALYDSLLANAGRYNIDLPDSNQGPTGLQRVIGSAPTSNKSISLSLRRQMNPNLELFAEFLYTGNALEGTRNPAPDRVVVASVADYNPFQQDVLVTIPTNINTPYLTNIINRGATLGGKLELPRQWRSEFDYTLSRSYYRLKQALFTGNSAARGAALFNDGTPLGEALVSGAYNPFVDTLQHPQVLESFLGSDHGSGSGKLQDMTLRAFGPLPRLPWGVPYLGIALERRKNSNPVNVYFRHHPANPLLNQELRYLPRTQVTQSAYMELLVPLVESGVRPLLHSLEMQLAGRTERFTVDMGTSTEIIRYRTGAPESIYSPNRDGLPYSERTDYSNTHSTVALKYQPVASVILRASLSTAFVPPTPYQLQRDPQILGSPRTIYDPQLDVSYPVYTWGGGNPNLKPENSESRNVGIVWEPGMAALGGLRINLEWYNIIQLDKIGTVPLQSFVEDPAFADRLTRDPAQGNRITLVDTSNVNLTRYETKGWDLSVGYRKATSLGEFAANFTGSRIASDVRQTTYQGPVREYAGYSGNPTDRMTLSLTWQRNQVLVGWTARYIGEASLLAADGRPQTFYTDPQGSDRLVSQHFHDAFLSYGLPDGRHWLLDGTTLFVGVKNVFNTWPAMDARDSSYYASPHANWRLRSYWLNVRKQL